MGGQLGGMVNEAGHFPEVCRSRCRPWRPTCSSGAVGAWGDLFNSPATTSMMPITTEMFRTSASMRISRSKAPPESRCCTQEPTMPAIPTERLKSDSGYQDDVIGQANPSFRAHHWSDGVHRRACGRGQDKSDRTPGEREVDILGDPRERYAGEIDEVGASAGPLCHPGHRSEE